MNETKQIRHSYDPFISQAFCILEYAVNSTNSNMAACKSKSFPGFDTCRKKQNLQALREQSGVKLHTQ